MRERVVTILTVGIVLLAPADDRASRTGFECGGVGDGRQAHRLEMFVKMNPPLKLKMKERELEDNIRHKRMAKQLIIFFQDKFIIARQR